MKRLIAPLAFAFCAGSAGAQTIPAPRDCAKVVVTRADADTLPALREDADCFRAEESEWDTLADEARKRQASARASAKYRENRAAIIEKDLPAGDPNPPEGDPVLVPVLSAQGVMELPKIASEFDRKPLLRTGLKIPGSAAPDPVGAFRFICQGSYLAYNDPIVFPNGEGMSHLHQFFGNTETNPTSTYASLRASGDSTCFNNLNRSGYWIPALMGKNSAGADVVIMSDYNNVYYKRRPASDPYFNEGEYGWKLYPINLPRGLRFVYGWPEKAPRFKCIYAAGGESGWKDDLSAALKNCGPGSRLDASVATPSCWNGKDLDSPDHRSHMAYQAKGTRATKYTDRCPKTHPYVITTFTLQSIYQILEGDRPETWEFSSAMMAPEFAFGSGRTFHGDWFGAWDDEAAKAWQDNCINKRLNCSSGNLGNGSMLMDNRKNAPGIENRNARLPVPKRPMVH